MIEHNIEIECQYFFDGIYFIEAKMPMLKVLCWAQTEILKFNIKDPKVCLDDPLRPAFIKAFRPINVEKH